MKTGTDQGRSGLGRPSSYSADIADRICERLAGGESLCAICSESGMPHRATVFRWLSQADEFRDMYARAREAQAEALADEILDIADAGGAAGQTADAVAGARLRVDVRKWIASKLKPRTYGERIQQDIAADVRVEAGDDEARAVALAERLERLARTSSKSSEVRT